LVLVLWQVVQQVEQLDAPLDDLVHQVLDLLLEQLVLELVRQEVLELVRQEEEVSSCLLMLLFQHWPIVQFCMCHKRLTQS
jgi:hypothetical protein